MADEGLRRACGILGEDYDADHADYRRDRPDHRIERPALPGQRRRARRARVPASPGHRSSPRNMEGARPRHQRHDPDIATFRVFRAGRRRIDILVMPSVWSFDVIGLVLEGCLTSGRSARRGGGAGCRGILMEVPLVLMLEAVDRQQMTPSAYRSVPVIEPAFGGRSGSVGVGSRAVILGASSTFAYSS